MALRPTEQGEVVNPWPLGVLLLFFIVLLVLSLVRGLLGF